VEHRRSDSPLTRLTTIKSARAPDADGDALREGPDLTTCEAERFTTRDMALTAMKSESLRLLWCSWLRILQEKAADDRPRVRSRCLGNHHKPTSLSILTKNRGSFIKHCAQAKR
jgi:hypothetical protein